MFDPSEFDDIRPYYDHEVKDAILRLVSNPLINKIVEYLFPGADPASIVNLMKSFTSVYEFQDQIMHKVIRSIVEQTSDGLTYEGFDKMDKKKSYLFVANHRDIMLDSGILQILLHENGFQTSEITFGSNLMKDPFVVDVGKLNKMFKVYRGDTGRGFYEALKKLSGYIRYTVTEKNQSVWIAQRNGRTKDGDDKTEHAVVKMFNISGKKNFIENNRELNITPVSISYEFDPCDILKVREMYLSASGPYIKQPGEDINSILTGIRGYKGRIHFVVGRPLSEELNETDRLKNENDKYKMLAQIIDRQIYAGFRLWPNNYIAYDLLDLGRDYSDKYSSDDKEKFLKHVDSCLSSVKDIKDTDGIRRILLMLYANPLLNREKTEME